MPEDYGGERVPQNYSTCLQFAKFAYMYSLGISGVGIENMRKMKQKHKWSAQLLSLFMEHPHESYLGTGGAPARDESDEDEKDFIKFGKATPGEKGWHIAGAALQMMWHIKWFQYIKELVPEHFTVRTNDEEKTAWEIFKESHKDLVKDGGSWLKDTSESCSVVAALITGVSFATCSSIPGGNKGDTGEPALEGKPAFEAFGISSVFGLCFSVTALIMFLSILTSRKETKDFRKDLPIKLFLGLSSLFLSIAAMIFSFCSGNFFVIENKFKEILFLIYGVTCLPVSLYAVAQFPLYTDLLKAIMKKVPQPSDKSGHLL
ncbi:uncharacterized protein LOC133307613 [Gastrolobium bilobum]|uniref:uncharacterized protein LOC133307613 n=1 Tax=Gastrolobium bilobum TaxID=150636 RepID=UPI002AB284ED|nr:uncharacterized protein LOC133307613 [Gastrolobium bilobum]